MKKRIVLRESDGTRKVLFKRSIPINGRIEILLLADRESDARVTDNEVFDVDGQGHVTFVGALDVVYGVRLNSRPNSVATFTTKREKFAQLEIDDEGRLVVRNRNPPFYATFSGSKDLLVWSEDERKAQKQFVMEDVGVVLVDKETIKVPTEFIPDVEETDDSEERQRLLEFFESMGIPSD